jgi:2-phospho-L-lactate guanylyltransferase
MRVWLLVPVKPFDQAKSRLAPALAPGARAGLSRRLLARTLEVAQASGLFAGILVISRDPAVLEFAHEHGVVAVRERKDDLNSALAQASQQARRAGAEAALVVPADLPLVTAADLRAICELGAAEADVVLAPAQDGGTNALWLRLPACIEFAFGPESFTRHWAAAMARRCRLAIYASDSIGLDLDRPEDLAMVGAELQNG